MAEETMRSLYLDFCQSVNEKIFESYPDRWYDPDERCWKSEISGETQPIKLVDLQDDAVKYRWIMMMVRGSEND